MDHLSGYRLVSGGERPIVLVQGTTLHDLFEQAGVAVFSIGWPVAEIPPTHSRPLVAPGDTRDELLEYWLEELLALHTASGIVFSAVAVDRLEEGGVQGSAAGMPAAEVMALGRPAVAVETPSGVVSIPEGFWVELEIELAPHLRGL